MSFLESVILAIVEGLTEFLPVSSTGHMIIAGAMMGISSEPFTKLFIVAIQFGAILSVVVLYRNMFFKSFTFYFKLFVAFLPAAVVGLLFGDYIDALLERIDVVGFMLVAGGVFFLFVDNIFRKNESIPDQDVSYPAALKIGFFQTIAIIPGVSRSAATIIGGLTQKLNRKNAAEFSFFLAVPTMFAATGYKLFSEIRHGYSFEANEVYLLLTGNVVAFLVAILAIKSFIRFLSKYGFAFFGYYRIIIGITILLLYYLGNGLQLI